MTINPFGPFDAYTVRARIYPGLLASLPIAVDVLLWRTGQLVRLWPLAVMAGGLFFLANYARSAGKRLEPCLMRRWNGMPTTHLLRHAELDNPVLFDRRRAALERVVGFPLPTLREEEQDPASADKVYEAAVKVLIPRVREQKERYPRVHEENIHYGYRRNLLGLKPAALTILGTLLGLDVAVLVTTGSTTSLIAGGIHLLLGALWLIVVKSEWVLQAGETYAERLFEALEDPALLQPGDNAASY